MGALCLSLHSLQPRDDFFEPADEALPTEMRALVVGLLFRPEARLLQAHARAVRVGVSVHVQQVLEAIKPFGQIVSYTNQ